MAARLIVTANQDTWDFPRGVNIYPNPGPLRPPPLRTLPSSPYNPLYLFASPLTSSTMSAPTLKLKPPFRAEHCGSLKRPEKLLAKRKEFDSGKCTQEDLTPVEDEAIREVITMQREVGIKSITDGEFRRCVYGVAIREVSCGQGRQTHVLRRRFR